MERSRVSSSSRCADVWLLRLLGEGCLYHLLSQLDWGSVAGSLDSGDDQTFDERVETRIM